MTLSLWHAGRDCEGFVFFQYCRLDAGYVDPSDCRGVCSSGQNFRFRFEVLKTPVLNVRVLIEIGWWANPRQVKRLKVLARAS
jgi:hypothetical protein